MALTNVAVKGTVVAPTVFANNVTASNINGVSTQSTFQLIRSVFTGALIGSWSVTNDILTVSISGIINDGPVATAPNTILGQAENYSANQSISFPGFIYCPAAPTIEQAGFLTTFRINEQGQFSADAPDVPGDRGAGDVRLRGWSTIGKHRF